MSFTDQKPRKATKKDLTANWGGYKDGKRFRCYLCGYKFQEGDTWRQVYAKKHMNFITCEKCDNDVIEKWAQANKELKERFWWYVQMYNDACQEYYR